MWNFNKNRSTVGDLYGAVHSANKILRITTILLSVCCIILVLALVFVSTRQKVVPWVIQVDEHGYEVAIGPAEKNTVVDQRIIISRIGRFVENLRTIVSDRNAQKKLVDWVYVSIPEESSALTMTNDFYHQNDPVKKALQGINVMVEIKSILPVSANTWRAEWIETTTDHGSIVNKEAWVGLFTVGITPTTDLSTVIKNPLGVFITEYTITKNYN